MTAAREPYTPEVVVLVGIQGSGKTTFAQAHYGATHVRISRDLVKTPNRERVLQFACLSIDQSFVADNSHPEPRSRAPLIAAAKAAGFRVVACFFPADVPKALLRNAGRSGKARVPDQAIHGTAAKLAPPRRDEGFDAVYVVHSGADGYSLEEIGD